MVLKYLPEDVGQDPIVFRDVNPIDAIVRAHGFEALIAIYEGLR